MTGSVRRGGTKPERQRLVHAHDTDRAVAWSRQLAEAHEALDDGVRDTGWTTAVFDLRS